MKITDLCVTPVAVPLISIKSKSRYKTDSRLMVSIVIELFTDDGLVGIGEAPPALGADIAESILLAARNSIIGKDPKNINRLMKEVYADFNLAHLHPHAGNWALNAIEMALWDIAGKRANLPLYELWGGSFRKKIEYYGHVERQDPASMFEEAKKLTNEGFKTLYTKVGLDTKDDLDAVSAMREGAGKDNLAVKIRVDPNQSWNSAQAIKMINEMSSFGLEYVDQPVLMYNLDLLKRVKDAVSVPIAAHESGWTIYEVLNVIKNNAADAIHIDPRFDLGLTGARISAGIAEAAGLPTISHSYGELGIAFSAAMHLISSSPSFILANQEAGYRDLVDDVIQGGKIKFHGPYAEVPSNPGLGVTLDKEKMLKYHENYIKEIRSKSKERNIDCFAYTAMYLRQYLKDND